MTGDLPAMSTEGLESLQDLIWFAPRERMKSRAIAGVEAVWQGLRKTGRYPTRGDIDPVDFKPWLPYLSLVDIHADPFRVRYRLVGTESVRFAGQDFSGKWLDETGWGEDYLTVNAAIYRRLYETEAPVFGYSVVEWHGRTDHLFEWALFPLVDSADRVAHSFSVDDFTSIAPRSHMLP